MTLAFLILLLGLFCYEAASFQASGVFRTTNRLHHLKSAVLDETETSTSLPPLLQDMVKERREFEMNLGKAMDTLRKDYPMMLHKSPDFSIYHDEISVLDPSGVQLTGLKNYKNSFGFLQTIVRFFYNTSESCVQNRMVYDFARQSIRISWNVMLVPKVVGNRRNALYFDGISIYKMDSKSGKIVEHKVEKLLVNNIPVTPPYGILTTLREELMYPGGQRIPVGVGLGIIAMYDMNCD
mmetsp:Transcript_17443/g.33068  ORF Transcript_17443/g.33068 Transcript_17443/m.33068 type:complete len:238 (-) Transcript_17443:209-922(-)|eukprot:CAMPEP_0176496980 /NCGR_PEP_ID=MMETSP0200_2-20121128/11478_1 /TAXON_ID=947934 /ORGANISM="Chaetoceros sp., Strain GSL56" /LENGTH=237 /DNA_ID=CAMNT_0017894959 /DNA_START=26 /DNA_END=739 /DNA_ORIENTATION=+